MKRAAAAGERELFYLDECGVAPTLPTSYTWAPGGGRPLLRYEAPARRRVTVLGALAPCGPRPRLVFQRRLASAGKLDGAAFLDFVCRLVGLPAGRATRATRATLPAAARRPPRHAVHPGAGQLRRAPQPGGQGRRAGPGGPRRRLLLPPGTSRRTAPN